MARALTKKTPCFKISGSCSNRFRMRVPGSARVSRAGGGVLAIANFFEIVHHREHRDHGAFSSSEIANRKSEIRNVSTSRCYGSLTTFNMLFKNKDDQFRTSAADR